MTDAIKPTVTALPAFAAPVSAWYSPALDSRRQLARWAMSKWAMSNGGDEGVIEKAEAQKFLQDYVNAIPYGSLFSECKNIAKDLIYALGIANKDKAKNEIDRLDDKFFSIANKHPHLQSI